GCGSVEKTTKEEKKVEPEVKETKPVIKNIEAVECEMIRSLKIREIDRIQFDYDEKGNLTNMEKLSTVVYDKNGFLEKTIIYDENEQVINTFSYKYNPDGLRTETLRYNSKGNPDKKYTYEY